MRGATLPRKHFFSIAATAATVGMLRFPAGAAEFNYRLANDLPPTHPVAAYASRAAAKIKSDTGGQLDIQVYPNSMLGGQADVITQAREGAIQFTLLGDDIFAGLVPVYSISRTPFAFAGYKDAWATMDGPLGSYLRDALTKAGVNMYRFQTVWDSGFREMMTGARPVNVPEDLRGLKMRIPQAPMPVAFFKAFGAAPTAVSTAELYTALQTHLVDGLDYPLSAAESFKLYEVQKYCAMTNHVWTGYTLHVNTDAWARLPRNVRDVVEHTFNAAAISERNQVAGDDATILASMTRQGMTFNRPPVAPFKAVVQNAGLYGQWRDSFGAEAWALLQKGGGQIP